jgi:hypothetical protein
MLLPSCSRRDSITFPGGWYRLRPLLPALRRLPPDRNRMLIARRINSQFEFRWPRSQANINATPESPAAIWTLSVDLWYQLYRHRD